MEEIQFLVVEHYYVNEHSCWGRSLQVSVCSHY